MKRAKFDVNEYIENMEIFSYVTFEETTQKKQEIRGKNVMMHY